jgi:anti-sigma regulatory factor (Ser/Thr protein kinase)
VNTSLSARSGFIHEALFYGSDDEYLAGTIPFVNEGLDQGDAVLIAIPATRLALLQDHLAPTQTPLLRFAPMEEVGRNPAWIIPTLAEFVASHGLRGTGARLVGEPIWSGRSADEIEECARHEMLVNLAFARVSGFRWLCPYNTTTLDADTLEHAHRSHPHVVQRGERTASNKYQSDVAPHLDSPLRPIPETAEHHLIDAENVALVRRRAGALATAAGFPASRVDDFVIAVSEAATNSVRHAGGTGEAAMWHEGPRLFCEIRDSGQISDPLAGRTRPPIDRLGGRGLWLIHQLCDLVQIRVVPDGQRIRLQLGL